MRNSEIIEKNFTKVGVNLAKKFKPVKDKFVLTKGFTDNEAAKNLLFHKWFEINEVNNNIKNCLVYLRSFKYYPKISKTQHLKFIFSSYLNEIYILQIRIEDYKKRIERVLRKVKNDEKYEALMKELNNIIEKIRLTLKNIITVRGSVIHVENYDDKDINEIAGYEYMVESQKMKLYNLFLKSEISKLKTKYLNAMKSNQKVIDELIEEFMGKVNEILFTNRYIEEASYNASEYSHIDGRE
jgi:hypothetical protein